MKLIKKNNKKGFTLIELVIVIAILAILALILVPAISKYVENANTTKNQASARTIYTNAVLANATIQYAEDATVENKKAALNAATADLSNITATTVDVLLDADGEVESITYTPESGTAVTFNGSTFNP